MSADLKTAGIRAFPPRQSGAVLVIGLLILLVMTLIGVTAMSTSTIEERMSANNMNANIAFQTAESAVTNAMSNLTTVTSALNAPGVQVSGPTVTYGSAVGDSKVTYTGTVIAEGWSLSGGYTAYQFAVGSTATVAAANARSQTDQGWIVIGPK